MRAHPPNPLTPTPSPAAAAPRSPALSPAPSHLSKGLERSSDRGEGQPPQDFPQSLEPGERSIAGLKKTPTKSELGRSKNREIHRTKDKTKLWVEGGAVVA